MGTLNLPKFFDTSFIFDIVRCGNCDDGGGDASQPSATGRIFFRTRPQKQKRHSQVGSPFFTAGSQPKKKKRLKKKK
jgi:hypothetical protein